MLENVTREEVNPPVAAAAVPSRYLGRDRPVPLGVVHAALLVLRVRQISHGVLGELADTDLIAAAPLVIGLSEQQELVSGEDHHKLPEGVLSSHIDLSHAPDPPKGFITKHRFVWALGQILYLAGKSMAFGGPFGPRIIICYLSCKKRSEISRQRPLKCRVYLI